MANDVNILLNARNNASGAIKQVQTDLRGLGGAASAASSGLSALAGAFTVGAVVAGVTALGGAMVDLANGAAKLETLRNSFDGLAAGVGQSSADMLESLRQASRGMISDADLLLSANKAMLLGVADTADEMTALMQIAMQRGAAMGLSTTQAFNDIVTGLGRGSALILDNLGIVVDAEANNEAYAASIGKVASALTEQEKKQALINAVMREAAGAAGDATSSLSEQAVAIGSMGAAWQNLKDQLGTLVSPAVATAMQGLADALNAVNTAIADSPVEQATADVEGLRKKYEETAHTLDVVKTMSASLQPGDMGFAEAERNIVTLTAQLRRYQAELSAAEAVQREAEYTASGLADKIGMLAGTYPAAGNAAAAAAPQVAVLTDAMRDQMAQAQANINAMNSLRSSVESFFLGLAGEMGGFAAGVGATELGAEIERERERMIRQGYDERTIQFQLQELYQQRTAEISENIRAQEKATATVSDYGRVATNAFDQSQSALNSLTSKVQSVLSLDAGIDASSLLPREDAVNENARRLADIAVNGFKDQDWLGAFAESVPDIFQALQESGDPQGAAAAMLRDFQDGLRPELLDKDRAKELVKRMIAGEASMAALAQEIAGELSQELGVALPQAQAAAFSTLGVKGGGAAAGMGDSAAEELSNETTLRSMAKAGAEAAMSWGTAFLDRVAEGVPAALVDMLTTLITPQVQAKLQAAQTQTGAQ